MVNGVSGVNFKANLQIVSGSDKLISKTRRNQLREKAKQIGTNYDRIYIGVWEKRGETPGSQITCISTAIHNFDIETPARKIENMAEVSGTASSRAKQIYKIIDNYLNDIKKAISEK